MTNHVHGRPDNEEEWLDDTIGRGAGDFDLPSGGRFIGVDLPQTNVFIEDPAHWSDLPTPATQRQEWELGDRMADGSDDQPYEPEEE